MESFLFKNKQDSYKKILDLILKKQRISRKEIAETLGLAWGTVSNNVNLMIDEKVIKEESPIITGIGRSTCYIVPNDEVYASLGVDINTVGLSASIVSLNGATIFFTMIPLVVYTQEEIIEKTYLVIKRALEFNLGRYQILSIGLSCQGDVYSQKGIFSDMPFIEGWQPINFTKLIEEKFNIPTFQSHDMECLLLDLIFRYPNNKDFLVCRVVDGIGFGVVKEGTILNEKISLDYGHEIVERNGLECTCGQCGCLEAYSSIKGLVKRLGISEGELFSNYKNYSSTLDDAMEKFAFSLYNVASIYNLSSVFVCGKLFAKIPGLFEKLIEKISKIEKRKNFNFIVTYLSDLSASFGAAIHSLRQLIE
ncbi:MAG: ROK family transcriptional regulator [bacterium]|nr:ROK family transcriptional regulator [bacterium]